MLNYLHYHICGLKELVLQPIAWRETVYENSAKDLRMNIVQTVTILTETACANQLG